MKLSFETVAITFTKKRIVLTFSILSFGGATPLIFFCLIIVKSSIILRVYPAYKDAVRDKQPIVYEPVKQSWHSLKALCTEF